MEKITGLHDGGVPRFGCARNSLNLPNMRYSAHRKVVLPEEIRQRIEQADEHTLLEWSESVLTATRLEEVLH